MKFTNGQTLKRFTGAVATRVIDRARSDIPAHAHDWPVLSLYRLGSFTNESEAGTRFLGSPCAIFYGAGAMHANAAGLDGFEQIEIEFDPAWLPAALPDAPIIHVTSGDLVRVVRRLGDAWERTDDESELRGLTAALVSQLRRGTPEQRPAWIASVEEALRRDPTVSIGSVAASVGRTPAWIGAAFARWTGETVQQASARLRVSRAAVLLREGAEQPASIAVGTGFCDQSHMIKAFRRVLGRTPQQVRADRSNLRMDGGTASVPYS